MVLPNCMAMPSFITMEICRFACIGDLHSKTFAWRSIPKSFSQNGSRKATPSSTRAVHTRTKRQLQAHTSSAHANLKGTASSHEQLQASHDSTPASRNPCLNKNPPQNKPASKKKQPRQTLASKKNGPQKTPEPQQKNSLITPHPHKTPASKTNSLNKNPGS